MRILLLARYGQGGASSRIRCYQYLPFFASAGIQVVPSPLMDDDYLRDLYAGRRLRWGRIAARYLRRATQLASSGRFDLVWIQAELFPWLPSWFEQALGAFGVRYIVEYDDAIFHRYDAHASALVRRVLGRKIDRVMRHASAVVVGNEYLASRARQAGASRIELIPSVVDARRYSAAEPSAAHVASTFTVGWIGSPTTAGYLSAVGPALEAFFRSGGARFVFVGAGRNPVADIPAEVVPWSETAEVNAIQQFDVGIMPLTDGAWERGKCGYKLIQYMACAKPVVASPVGANLDIVQHGTTGFLPADRDGWLAALNALKSDPALAGRLGEAGRRRVEENYCLQVTVPRWVSLLRDMVPDPTVP